MGKIYITTPIYYVNDLPHLGHAYTTIIADVAARYFQMKGEDVFFLTGTDEHGQKIEEAAKKRGKTPKEYADSISKNFKELWDFFEISYSKFIRTTDEEHIKGVKKAFEKMYKKGDIYKGIYEGYYCISCESFFTKKQLINDEFCPDCGRVTQIVKEESYFFRLSKYEEELLKWYEKSNPILPKSRKNEVVRFVKGGLSDISITRTGFKWGIPLPSFLNDEKHIIYVWLDALLNYITALGYGMEEKLFSYWPAAYHFVGKDILRFHAIYWPAFLMSLELPLPKYIAAHGWWTRNGEKMSKSKGNVLNPKEIAEVYGKDNFRYFILREVPFGQDGDFSQRALIDRINNDLGNDLGNLLNRIIGMSGKYFKYVVEGDRLRDFYRAEVEEIDILFDKLDCYAREMRWNKYLETVWKALAVANKSIDKYAPWKKIKENKHTEAMALIALCSNILARSALALYPIMPEISKKIAEVLNFEINFQNYQKLIEKKNFLPKIKIKKIPPLFPKIDKPLIEEKKGKDDEVKNIAKAKNISIEESENIKIKIGKIVEVEDIKESDRLYLLRVDIGEERLRNIVAGIKKYYKSEELINKEVCVVANLKPAKIRGILSEGMILAAKDKKGLSLVAPLKEVDAGSLVK